MLNGLVKKEIKCELLISIHIAYAHFMCLCLCVYDMCVGVCERKGSNHAQHIIVYIIITLIFCVFYVVESTK